MRIAVRPALAVHRDAADALPHVTAFGDAVDREIAVRRELDDPPAADQPAGRPPAAPMRLGTDLLYVEDAADGRRFHGFVLDDWLPGRRPVRTLDVIVGDTDERPPDAGPCVYAFPSAKCVVRVTAHAGVPRYEVYSAALWRAMEAWRAIADPRYAPAPLLRGSVEPTDVA